jgi:adenylate cyclase, class 2
MIEVELKFELTSQVEGQLQQILESVPAMRYFKQIDQVDSYYDTEAFDCLQQSVFVRIRDQSSLEIKYHEDFDPLHTHSTEQAFPLPIKSLFLEEMNGLFVRFIPAWKKAENLDDAFVRNGLVEFVSIEKQRRQYTYEDIVFCLDTIQGLGKFLELETSCREEQDVAFAEARLRSVLTQFGLPSLSTVNVGYVELWLRQHREDVYFLGKYLLEDDAEQKLSENSNSVV